LKEPTFVSKLEYMDIHVSNIPFKLTEEELIALFKEFGQVESASIVIDHKTRQNKGFGFVKMYKDSEAHKAIAALNKKVVMERVLRVSRSINKDDKKEELKPKVPFWKRTIKKKTRVVTFGDEHNAPKKGIHKKRRGHGRGTTY
jgi:RNA recognition motif-containing protein